MSQMSLFGAPTIPETLLPAAEACKRCRLCDTNILSPKIVPYGQYRRKIMVIGEGPGAEEDKTGKPWQGKAGQLLRRELNYLGIDLFRDCISYNSVNCRPTTKGRGKENRTPNNNEITLCRNHVLRAVYKYKPKVIILLGGSAVQSVIGARWTKNLEKASRWVGHTIPDREFRAWLCPTYHPSYIMRIGNKAIDTVFRQHLQQALDKEHEPLPQFRKEEDCVTIVESTRDLVSLIRKHRSKLVAWDYETTGIKPFETDVHKVVSVAFSPTPDTAYVTAYPEMRYLRGILANKRIAKIAQNMKFEGMWTQVMGRYPVKNQIWDTMLASHVLDNRSKITSLKFQAYIRFGLAGYDSEVEPYLKSKSKDTNVPNRIEDAMSKPYLRRKVLVYNGVDALLTHRLALLQAEELGAVLT